MNVKRIAAVLLFCFACAAWARGQGGQLIPAGVEYGDLSELVGKRRVFVHAENLSTRDRIVKELLKAPLPGLEVVGRVEDADFILVFDAGTGQTGQGVSETFYADGGDGAFAVSGGLIALKLVSGGAGQRTRVLWHAQKRQAFVRTEQFFRPTYSGSTRSNLIGMVIGGLLVSIPKLSMIPVGRSPEVKATRDFVKALREAYERTPQVGSGVHKSSNEMSTRTELY